MNCSRLSGFVLPLVLLAASASAQVTASATVITGAITLQAGALPPVTTTIAAGTVVPFPTASGFVIAMPGWAMGRLFSGFESTASAVTLRSAGMLVCAGPASGSLAIELLLSVTPAQPVPVAVELEWTIGTTPGASLPIVEVDFDNDGTFDMLGSPNRTVRIPMVLAAARQFRLRSVGSATATVGSGFENQEVLLRVVPDHRDVGIFPITTPCNDTLLDVEQTFVRGVSIGSGRLAQVAPPRGLPFLVIGFAPQFTPLPPAPLCFLLPRTDIVVPFPRAPLVLDAAVVGPLQFYVQGVWLGFSPYPTTATNGEFVRF